MGGNGSGGGVGVGDGPGGVGLAGDGVSCMIHSRFMSGEVETSLFLSWRDKLPLLHLSGFPLLVLRGLFFNPRPYSLLQQV